MAYSEGSNGRALTISQLGLQTEGALNDIRARMTTGKPDRVLLQRARELKEAQRHIPEKFLLLIDRSGSTDNDMPLINGTVTSIRQTAGEQDCPVALFGDAKEPMKMWDGNKPLENISFYGYGNRHEGGAQSILYGLKHAGIDMSQRSVESRPVHVYVITDEHADGVLDGMEVSAEARRDFRQNESSTKQDLPALMRKLKEANVVVHAFTPEQNTDDYAGDPILCLGQVWQSLAAMTGGDWTKLGNNALDALKAVQAVQAQTTGLLLSATREVQNLLQLTSTSTGAGDGKQTKTGIISI